VSVGRPGGHLLTEAERRSFVERGFTAVERPVVPAALVAEVRTLIADLLERRASLPADSVHDLADGRVEGAMIPEVINARLLEPRLLGSSAYAICEQLAMDALGGKVTLDFDHAIGKPPHNAAATAWHQDLAFNPLADWPTATVWLALTDATEDNGCMRYIPTNGSRRLLSHEPFGRDGLRTLELSEDQAVVCPVPAGGVTLHNQRTLHGSGPNTTDGPRLAWILKFVAGGRSTQFLRAQRKRVQESWGARRGHPIEAPRRAGGADADPYRG